MQQGPKVDDRLSALGRGSHDLEYHACKTHQHQEQSRDSRQLIVFGLDRYVFLKIDMSNGKLYLEAPWGISSIMPKSRLVAQTDSHTATFVFKVSIFELSGLSLPPALNLSCD